MAKVLPYTEIAAGIVITAAFPGLQPWGYKLIALGAAQLVAQELQDKPVNPDTRNPTGIDGLVRDTDAFGTLIYGEQRVGGVMTYFNTTLAGSGSGEGLQENGILDYVVTHAFTDPSRGVEAMTDVWVDGKLIKDEWIDAGGNVTQGAFAGLVQIWRYDGTQTTADSVLVSAYQNDPEVPYRTTDIGRGVVYTHIRFTPGGNGDDAEERFKKAYEGHSPYNVEVLIKGEKVLNKATGITAYSTNPIWCIRDYLTRAADHNGCGFPATILNDSIDSASANECSETITYPGTSRTGPRFSFSGLVDLGSSRRTIVSDMLTSMAGEINQSGGTIGIYSGSFTPSSGEIDDSFLRGSASTAVATQSDRYNYVRATFRDRNNDYQSMSAPPYPKAGSTTYNAWKAADGGYRIDKDIELPFTDNADCAQVIEQIVGNQSRHLRSLQLECNVRGLSFKTGDRVTVNLPEIGETGRLYKIIKADIREDYGVDLTLREDDASIWGFDNVIAQEGPYVSNSSPSFTNPPAPSNVICVPVVTGLSIHWTRDGYHLVTSYEVWRSETEDGVYAKVATVSGSNYIDPITDSTKTYYYKVRSFNGYFYSDFTQAVFGNTLDYLQQGVPIDANVGGQFGAKVFWNSVSDGLVYKNPNDITQNINPIQVITPSGDQYSADGSSLTVLNSSNGAELLLAANFLMFTGADPSRFSDGLSYTNINKDLVIVRKYGDQWEYNNGDGYLAYTPNNADFIIGHVVANTPGSPALFWSSLVTIIYPDGTPIEQRQPEDAGATAGVPVDMAQGGQFIATPFKDNTFPESITYHSVSNPADDLVGGSIAFIHPDGTKYSASAAHTPFHYSGYTTLLDVLLGKKKSPEAYLAYTGVNTTRFTGAANPDLLGVRKSEGQWQWNDGSAWKDFSVQQGDCLLGHIKVGSDGTWFAYADLSTSTPGAYADGTKVEDRKPAAIGADVTGDNTANDVKTGAGKAVVERGADVTGNNTSASTSTIDGHSNAALTDGQQLGNKASWVQVTQRPTTIVELGMAEIIQPLLPDATAPNQVLTREPGGDPYWANKLSAAYAKGTINALASNVALNSTWSDVGNEIIIPNPGIGICVQAISTATAYCSSGTVYDAKIRLCISFNDGSTYDVATLNGSAAFTDFGGISDDKRTLATTWSRTGTPTGNIRIKAQSQGSNCVLVGGTVSLSFSMVPQSGVEWFIETAALDTSVTTPVYGYASKKASAGSTATAYADVTVQATGGTGNYSYTWSVTSGPGAIVSGGNSKTCTVNDTHATASPPATTSTYVHCVVNDTVQSNTSGTVQVVLEFLKTYDDISVSVPDAECSCTTQFTQETCTASGTLTAGASGGDGSYGYSWSNTGTFGSIVSGGSSKTCTVSGTATTRSTHSSSFKCRVTDGTNPSADGTGTMTFIFNSIKDFPQ